MTSPTEFKQAMRHLAGGVSIIATEHEGVRAGLAATAVCSVSADPPTILICINSSASAHDPIRESGRFSVNLLASDHDRIARGFSGQDGVKREERFSLGSWAPSRDRRTGSGKRARELRLQSDRGGEDVHA